ncbi:twin-arginine translocase subunit TatC [Streptomyces beijiangensis]|uniref:Sec-independent protein translocase protein TatC n=1 Tax=Streptomyces beijiangensis TaxID=163361 RepID=A0A939F605_9ACTN|nr:twin-arginine translocase subunit TatC [Streptomyces beijiangensis]MBO0512349.1 twin-arginine translocase subunit TatC [Streptomyces beijiangensis]
MLKSARTEERDPEGRMPLADHLRELRNRLAKGLLAILLVTIVAAFFYNDIIEFFTKPILKSVGCHASFAELAKKPEAEQQCAQITINGLLAPFTLALKVSLMAGVVLASPVWLYQLWAFLAPGLHKTEKKYSLSFVGAGFPLFLCGGYFAYAVLPTTAKVLIGFTPGGVDNLLPLDDLLDLVTRMVVVFGLAFEMPLLLVMLNFGGVVTGKRMIGWWRAMIIGITVFAAVATPSTDPLSMLALSVPIWVLYFVACIIALLNDRRRRQRAAEGPDDDEASDLDLTPEDIGEIENVTTPSLPEQSDGGRSSRLNGYDDIT